MNMGRVTGTVVSTIQHPFYDGKKQLIVRNTLPDGSFDGDKYVIAVDLVGAGVGELVLIEDEGNSARQLMNTASHAPVRSVIVGIIDDVQLEEA